MIWNWNISINWIFFCGLNEEPYQTMSKLKFQLLLIKARGCTHKNGKCWNQALIWKTVQLETIFLLFIMNQPFLRKNPLVLYLKNKCMYFGWKSRVFVAHSVLPSCKMLFLVEMTVSPFWTSFILEQNVSLHNKWPALLLFSLSEFVKTGVLKLRNKW